MTVTDAFEWIAALALGVAFVNAARWFRLTPRAVWHRALPALFWLINESLFVVVVIAADVSGQRVAVNVWSLVLIIQGILTLAWYFWVMRSHGHH